MEFSSVRRIDEIEQLRGLAILLVLTAHAPIAAVIPPHFDGRTGVDLFFVISGFVVTLSLLARLPSGGGRLEAWPEVKAFFIRRFFRVGPMALLACLLALLSSAALNRHGEWGSPSRVLHESLMVFSLGYNYWAVATNPHDLVHFWSLTVEEHFYLLLPLVLVIFRDDRRRALVVTGLILAIVFVLRLQPSPTYEGGEGLFIYYASQNRFDGLLGGVLLALGFRNGALPGAVSSDNERFYVRLISLGAVALLASALTWDWPSKPPLIVGISVASLAGFVLVLFASYGQGLVFSSRLTQVPLGYLGTRSYSLYLLHPICWRAVANLAGGIPDGTAASIPVTLAYLAVLLVSAEACYRGVQVPLRERGRALASRRGALVARVVPGL